MLALVGLGLYDEKDVGLRGIEQAKSSDLVYAELYTSGWQGSLEALGKAIGKEVVQLSRKELEEESQKILSEAKEKEVTLFVPGDPLVATTHVSLLLEAKKRGIETKVIHSSSIVSAVAETGLHAYKFGAIVTIPFLEKTQGKLPESVYKTIQGNKSLGLHTLCLLDISERLMTVNEGVKTLLQMEEKFGQRILSKTTQAVVYSNVGSQSQVYFGILAELLEKSLAFTPSVIIIPAELHFTEREFLEAGSKA